MLQQRRSATARPWKFEARGAAARVEFEAPQEDSMSDKFDRRDFLRGDRLRAQRVLSVEAVMDVERAILWPDSAGEQPAESDSVEVACSQEGRRTRS